ncbi:MAG: hypothetical protein PVS3B2_01430 [Candidatus Dormibacteraceae bacterium]
MIAVTGLAGTVITYAADGSGTWDWSRSEPLIGDYRGHEIKIVLRGSATYQVRADGTHIVEAGPSQDLTVSFYYDGVLKSGGHASKPADTISYTCGANRLRLETPAANAGYGPKTDELAKV